MAKKTRNANILLAVFALSVSLISIFELGHEVLHTFENPIHHHAVKVRKATVSHTLVDHHFSKMKFAHEMEEAPQPSNNFIALLYGFFSPLDEYQFNTYTVLQLHQTSVVQSCYSVHTSPLTPPPLVHS